MQRVLFILNFWSHSPILYHRLDAAGASVHQDRTSNSGKLSKNFFVKHSKRCFFQKRTFCDLITYRMKWLWWGSICWQKQKLHTSEELARELNEKLRNINNENMMLRVKQKEDLKHWIGLESKLSMTKAVSHQLTDTFHRIEVQVFEGLSLRYSPSSVTEILWSVVSLYLYHSEHVMLLPALFLDNDYYLSRIKFSMTQTRALDAPVLNAAGRSKTLLEGMLAERLRFFLKATQQIDDLSKKFSISDKEKALCKYSLSAILTHNCRL